MSQFTACDHPDLPSLAQIHPSLIPPRLKESCGPPNGYFHAHAPSLPLVSTDLTDPHGHNSNIHPVYSSTTPVSHMVRPPPASGARRGAFHPPASVNDNDLFPPYTQAGHQDLDELPANVVPLPHPPPIQPTPPHHPPLPCLPTTPHMFTCNVSFVLYGSRQNKQKKLVHKAIQSAKALALIFDCRTITYASFLQQIGVVASRDHSNAARVLNEGTNSSPPTIFWTAYINSNKDWPNSSPRPLSDHTAFTSWIDSITVKKANKGGVSMSMQSPGQKIAIAKGNDLLAETVRRNEARAVTQASRARACLTQSGSLGTGSIDDIDSEGDSCDEEFEARAIIKEDILNKYKRNTGVDPSHPVYPDPTDINQYIILTPANVALWAKAMHNQEPGVSLLSPPGSIKYYTRKPKRGLAGHSDAAPQMNTADIVATMMQVYQATTGFNPPAPPPAPPPATTSGDDPTLVGNQVNPSVVLGPGSVAENAGSLLDYLNFAGVSDPTKTLDRLMREDIDSYTMFAPGYLRDADMDKLGLSVGTLTRLRGGVDPYHRSLTHGRP
ncbi:hypothetical protein PTTG_25302 [Puccinia triticina 1-1 BBBD Race 1]|uniref:Uncharacterized protein n=1 Tax=Puccinia triticina (isolate 1-1 / race 1 (BBBD)) TaxID=630390 RepID=A0A180H4A2_PUCT1|nr:hypothetical protein PTTG_25302 [Puccinia triticina 1-1 BBBD Race 1]